MHGHTTISVDKPEGNRFRDAKPDTMSATEFLRELLDEYEGSASESDVAVTNEDLLAELRAIPEKTRSQFDTGY